MQRLPSKLESNFSMVKNILQEINKGHANLIALNKKAARTLLSNLSNRHITNTSQISNITTS